MERARYDEYIRRFNEEDPTAFEEFLSPDMKMLNGGLEFTGIEGMKSHYMERIWPHFIEKLHILNYLSDETQVAVRMWTHFTAKHDADTLFGSVRAGDAFDYRGLLLYEVKDGRFTSITVAYNSFSKTHADGTVEILGIPH